MKTDRQRLRRRLLLVSAPVVAVVLILAGKLASVAVVGDSVVTDYAHRDTAALSDDVAILHRFNVIEPARTSYAGGSLAVLQHRLDDADREFGDALARTTADRSCPVRINLELIRETLGDQAAAAGDRDTAVRRYTAAKDVVTHAPGNCFAGNTDADPERRRIRAEALPRLDAKLATTGPPQTAPPPPRPAAPPPAPPPASGDASATLAPPLPPPDSGDPLRGLQQILRDAAQ
ncbi:hypothetical protein [Mycolicibacterium phocaicum]|uniref:hypothetical protein n=1 Tax=Mycolicibacterium phocaicum TaxID=319706 RepID=UPI001CFA5BCF|nr:hypothetical protein [Mycolicibacterium phocaicum]UCZ58086.1 hypothetical protein LHJ73_14820 [Mycolicibacterium phocaicum]